MHAQLSTTTVPDQTTTHPHARPSANGKKTQTHLILQPQKARPTTQDERIVRSDDRDDVDALGLELVEVLQERREVVHVARWLYAHDSSIQSEETLHRGPWHWCERGRTVNAPGTATRTTFLPFHSSVFSVMAAHRP